MAAAGFAPAGETRGRTERLLTVHVQAVSPETCPALVLNADFRPLSYYPLSIWCWQDAIKAVFLDRVNIVSEYDTLVRSPSFEMRLPSVVSLKSYVKPSRFPAFTRFNVFLRDRFTCQYCGEREDLTFDHVVPRSKGGVTTLGERRRRLLGLQPEEGRPAAVGRAHVAGAPSLPADGARPASERPAVPAQLPPHLAGWTTSTGTASWSREACRNARLSISAGWLRSSSTRSSAI